MEVFPHWFSELEYEGSRGGKNHVDASRIASTQKQGGFFFFPVHVPEYRSPVLAQETDLTHVEDRLKVTHWRPLVSCTHFFNSKVVIDIKAIMFFVCLLWDAKDRMEAKIWGRQNRIDKKGNTEQKVYKGPILRGKAPKSVFRILWPCWSVC